MTTLIEQGINIPKIIYYYQTFCRLNSILYKNTPVTHIHLSSIHFGYNTDSKGHQIPYIHLNNNNPESHKFDDLWNQLSDAKAYGIKIILMVGGAGTAYQKLFADYETFYPLLKEVIQLNRNIIDGIDLDIEEPTLLKNVKMLINDIDKDFGKDFIISMAPVQFTMENTNEPGMSGFKYIQLYDSPEGKRIDYFNVQAYSSYTCASLDTIVKNGYPVEKIVMGMLTGQDYNNIKTEVSKMVQKYKSNFGGVFIWEYYDAPPSGITNPVDWAIDMQTIINKYKNTLIDTEAIINNIDKNINSLNQNISENYHYVKTHVKQIFYNFIYHKNENK